MKEKNGIKKHPAALLVLLFLCTVLFTSAQSPLDSLIRLSKSSLQDSVRLRILIEISEQCETSEIEKYCSEAVVIADKLLSQEKNEALQLLIKKKKALALNNIGFACERQSSFARALKHYSPALKLQIETNDLREIANTLNNVAAVFIQQGEIITALDFFTRTLKLREYIGDSAGIANSYHNLAYIYQQRGDVTTSVDYYLRSLKLRERLGNKAAIAATLNSIGFLYQNQGQDKESLQYFERSLKLQQEVNDKWGAAYSLNNIGTVISRLAAKLPPGDTYFSEMQRAYSYYARCLDICKEINNPLGEALAYNNIGNMMMNMATHERDKKSKLDSALMYLKKCYAIQVSVGEKKGMAYSLYDIGVASYRLQRYSDARKFVLASIEHGEKLHDVKSLINSFGLLSRLDSLSGDFKSSFSNYKRYVIYRDSLLNTENTKKMVRSEMQYNFEKKEQVANAERSKKDAVDAAEKKRQRVILIFVIAGLLLVITFSVFVVIAYRQKVKANFEITVQKNIIEEKQKEIVDSIMYAQRIQSALLPGERQLEKTLLRLKKNRS